MAFHSQIGVGSAFPALDGVPFTLNEKCRPPPKVALPMKYEAGNPSQVLFFDYDTSLELSVMRQLHSEREAADAAAQARCKIEQAAAAVAASTQQNLQHDSDDNNKIPDKSSSEPKSDVLAQFVNGSGMLLPTPISASSCNPAGSSALTGSARIFDPKDFESEQDPFEQLSLRVMNDREELNKVFCSSGGTGAPSRSFPSNSVPSVPVPAQTGSTKAAGENHSAALMQFANCVTSSSAISYVPCQPFAGVTTTASGRNSPAAVATAIRYPPGYIPSTTSSISISNGGRVSYTVSPLAPPAASTVACSLLRSAKSNPDIPSLGEENAGIGARRTPPPTSSFTRSTDAQVYDVRRPIPIRPFHESQPPAVVTRKSEAYLLLSVEAQHFADTICDMGFHETDVTRAVKELGVDDKQVLDHLCLLVQLRDKGYLSADAAAALFLFDGSVDKAEMYLKLVKSFTELGFQRDRITDVLIRSDLDEEKSLDLLVGTS